MTLTSLAVPPLSSEALAGTETEISSESQDPESTREQSSSSSNHDYDPDFIPGSTEEENEVSSHAGGDEDAPVNDRVIDRDRRSLGEWWTSFHALSSVAST